MNDTPKHRHVTVAAGLVALCVTALNHFHGYDEFLVGLNTQKTLLPFEQLTKTPPSGEALTQHVTLLFLDGLNDSEAKKLPHLSKAMPSGATRALWVDFPSYTYPAVVSYDTGVPPLYSGVRINQVAHAPPFQVSPKLPTLLEYAARAGLAVRISSQEWPELRTLLDAKQAFPEVPVEQALSSPKPPGITWLYFGQIDEAGHQYGRSSEEYQAAARRGDELVADVLASVDLTKETLIVLSDHGHLWRGGHGGHEEEVRQAFFFAIGAGIAPKQLPSTSYLDVAPTLALLLGISVPAASLGQPMLDLMPLSEEDKARHLASAFWQRSQAESLLSPYPAPREDLYRRLKAKDPSALSEALSQLATYQQQREEAFLQERDQRALQRLFWVVPLLLGLLVLLLWLRRLGRLVLKVRDLAPTLLYTACFLSLYFLFGYGFSWSLPRGSAGFMIETLFFGVIGVLAAFGLSRKMSSPPRLLEETCAMTLFFGVPYLLTSVWVGLDAHYLGDPVLSYLVIFFATIGFYAHGPFAVALLLKARTTSSWERSASI